MNATQTKSTEIASRKWAGQYGFGCQTRLVRHKGQAYLVHDQFCGLNTPRGGAYRPQVYAVAEAQVAQIKMILEHQFAEDESNDFHPWIDGEISRLACRGEQHSEVL